MTRPIHIATSLCAGSRGDRSKYPQLGGLGSRQRRHSFWRCVVVFFASSLRCNPAASHVLFTNDRRPPRVDGVDVERLLSDWGVSIVQLPFTFLPPRHASRSFRNTYYKLDAIKALGAHASDMAMHLDADCIWTRSGKPLFDFVRSDRLTLYDVYRRSDPSEKAGDLTAFEMADLYRAIDPQYPEPTPTRFGGELIAGRAEWLSEIGSQLTEVFADLAASYAGAPPRFTNGRTIFDGEEYLSCFVLNKFWRNRWQDAGEYIKRIWLTNVYSNMDPTDLQKIVWHMPAEKQQGFPLLFREATDPGSDFFRVPIEEFAAYLGEYVGIPKRKKFCREQRVGTRIIAPLRGVLRVAKRRLKYFRG